MDIQAGELIHSMTFIDNSAAVVVDVCWCVVSLLTFEPWPPDSEDEDGRVEGESAKDKDDGEGGEDTDQRATERAERQRDHGDNRDKREDGGRRNEKGKEEEEEKEEEDEEKADEETDAARGGRADEGTEDGVRESIVGMSVVDPAAIGVSHALHPLPLNICEPIVNQQNQGALSQTDSQAVVIAFPERSTHETPSPMTCVTPMQHEHVTQSAPATTMNRNIDVRVGVQRWVIVGNGCSVLSSALSFQSTCGKPWRGTELRTLLVSRNL